MERVYIAIDLKSFYASVECVERGLDPMTTHLVVADRSRTEKTICLAVSPSLKAYGLPGRARLFEVVQKVEAINALRRAKAPGRTFTESSSCKVVLICSKFGSISFFFSLSNLFATTMNGLPDCLKHSIMVQSSAVGLCRASTI